MSGLISQGKTTVLTQHYNVLPQALHNFEAAFPGKESLRANIFLNNVVLKVMIYFRCLRKNGGT
jgi:hypothetical protein